MILLVVGLVAVIVVVLIAVFLSIRLGRGDEHDEHDLRSDGRDRRRDQGERWQDGDSRRVPGSRGGRGENQGYSSRGPARAPASRGRDYDSASRRPARDPSDYSASPSPHRPTQASPSPHRPTQAGSSPRRPTPKPAAARSAVGASAQARDRYDGGPSRRPAADDFPSADYPSMDFGPAENYATGDHPSVEFPAVMEDPRDRPDSRRKPAPAPANGKSRSRQRSKRDDDDDWPSSEWDKLSDEQYWAELSADKPLSTMARPSRPASTTAAKAPSSGGVKANPAPWDARSARPPAPDRDLPSRNERDQREPVTERLPVRASRQAPPPLPPARREADLPVGGRSYPDPRSVLDSGPHSSRDTGPHQARNTGPLSARDTGPQPTLEPRRRDTTGPQPTRDRDLAMLTGFASAPPPIPGALEDDPLTSPSFSLKAVPTSDTRSYSNARKHAKTTPAADHVANGAAHANGNGHGANGHSSGGSPAGDYADPAYAYHSAPPAAPAAAASDWYSAPPAPAAPAAEAQTSAYGNPYAHTGSGNGASAAQTGSYNNYLADPLRVYSPPGYEAPAPYAEPASPAAYQAAPPPAGAAPYTDGYPSQPYADPSGYQDGYSTGGYAPGYEAGYPGDPYASGGYAPYPPQG
jgi:hypothetical protein